MKAFINEVFDIMDKQPNEKVREALTLFFKCDDDMKRVALYASGFKGRLSPQNLITHFETMDLMDTLDSAIYDMRWDLEENQ